VVLLGDVDKIDFRVTSSPVPVLRFKIFKNRRVRFGNFGALILEGVRVVHLADVKAPPKLPCR